MPTRTTAPGATHRTCSFGEFTLDVDRGALLRAGRDVKLRPKSFEVLRYLVERQGLLVSRDELLDAIWGRTIVTEDAVTQCLRDIRKALGDRSQQIIRTVPRRGYIFELAVTEDDSTVASRRPHWPLARPLSRKTDFVIIGLLSVALIMMVINQLIVPGKDIRLGTRSLIVLPLATNQGEDCRFHAGTG